MLFIHSAIDVASTSEPPVCHALWEQPERRSKINRVLASEGSQHTEAARIKNTENLLQSFTDALSREETLQTIASGDQDFFLLWRWRKMLWVAIRPTSGFWGFPVPFTAPLRRKICNFLPEEAIKYFLKSLYAMSMKSLNYFISLLL